MGIGEYIVGTAAISFVTFLLTWGFVFRPRLEEVVYQRDTERDLRIELQDAANPEGNTSTVKIVDYQRGDLR